MVTQTVQDIKVAERKYVNLLRELSRAEDWQYYMAPKSHSNAVYGMRRISSLEKKLKEFRGFFGFSRADIARMKNVAGYKTLEQKYGL